MTDHLPELRCSWTTLVELLRWRARHEPERPAYSFLENGEIEGPPLTWGALDRQARALAVTLRAQAAQGDRALLLYPPGLEFVVGFFGCLYAGILAIPTPLPSRRRLKQVQAVAADAQPAVLLTTAATTALLENVLDQEPDLAAIPRLATDTIGDARAGEWQAPDIGPATIALLQYTSGSTASPKGVIITHANLLYTCANMDSNDAHTAESILVTWLPTFHDMGLIYGVIEPLFLGFRCYMMAPAAFLRDPLSWLRAITRYHATHSASPNFGYDLCVRKMTPEQGRGLELSSWTGAVIAAEPVRKGVLERFTATFGRYGFRWETFSPGYGLAEATLKVSMVQRDAAPVFCTVESAALEQHRVVEAPEGAPGTRTLAGCGPTALATRVAIVHPELLRACAPDEVGEIWVAGPNVTAGYWRRPEETARTFHAYIQDTGEGPFLRTGDLGFLRGDTVYISGRLKDLIILDGRNHYPQDIELTVTSSHPALVPEGTAAFPLDTGDSERLVVVAEVEVRAGLQSAGSPASADLIKAIRRAVAEEHEIRVYDVVLIRPGRLPKTSSAKIARYRCRADYLAGALERIDR